MLAAEGLYLSIGASPSSQAYTLPRNLRTRCASTRETRSFREASESCKGTNGRQRAPQLASRPFARKGPRLSGYQSAPDRPGQPSCPRNWTGWSARRRDVQVDVNPWRHCVDRDEAAQLLAELRPSASLVVSGQLPCASIKKKCRVTLLTSSRSKQRDCSEHSSTAIYASWLRRLLPPILVTNRVANRRTAERGRSTAEASSAIAAA